MINKLCLSVLLSVFAVNCFSQTENGRILSSEPFPIKTPYHSLSDFLQWYYPKELYQEAQSQQDFESLRIRYLSDGHKVEGFIYKPKQDDGVKRPVIIWNRGGTGDFGKLDESSLVSFYLLAKEGYVIVASNLRYINEMEQYDQSGGDDLNDVLNLFPLIESLDYVDHSRVYMVGFSRGALMTHLAIQKAAPIRAAAVIAGVTDSFQFYKDRPEFINGWNKDGFTFNGLKKNLTGFEASRDEHLAKRSPILWANELNKPLLILHSRTDSRVSVEYSLKLANALQKNNKTYSLVIYDDDGHSLPLNRNDVNNRIVSWFKKFSDQE